MPYQAHVVLRDSLSSLHSHVVSLLFVTAETCLRPSSRSGDSSQSAHRCLPRGPPKQARWPYPQPPHSVLIQILPVHLKFSCGHDALIHQKLQAPLCPSCCSACAVDKEGLCVGGKNLLSAICEDRRGWCIYQRDMKNSRRKKKPRNVLRATEKSNSHPVRSKYATSVQKYRKWQRVGRPISVPPTT